MRSKGTYIAVFLFILFIGGHEIGGILGSDQNGRNHSPDLSRSVDKNKSSAGAGSKKGRADNVKRTSHKSGAGLISGEHSADNDPSPGSPGKGNTFKKGTYKTEGDTPEDAAGWFRRGLALDDDSSREIACYKKALQLDPDFAPAHYRMAAIYLRRADFEKSDEHFALFWAKATPEEKKKYDIHVYTNERAVERKLREIREKKDNPSEKHASVSYKLINDQVIVPVSLNGEVNTQMLLDTGASITVISEDLARKAGGSKIGNIELKTIARGGVTARVVRVRSLRFGPVVKKNVPVAVVDVSGLGKNGIDGILGMDVIRGKSLNIDQSKGKVILK